VKLKRQDTVAERLRESNRFCLWFDETLIVPGGPILGLLLENLVQGVVGILQDALG